MNTCTALATTTQKGSSTTTEYLEKMKTLSDEIMVVGKPCEDDLFISHVITSLDSDDISIVSTILARVKPILLEEFYCQLLSINLRCVLICSTTLVGIPHRWQTWHPTVVMDVAIMVAGMARARLKDKGVVATMGGVKETLTILNAPTIHEVAATTTVTNVNFVVVATTQLLIASTASMKISCHWRRVHLRQ